MLVKVNVWPRFLCPEMQLAQIEIPHLKTQANKSTLLVNAWSNCPEIQSLEISASEISLSWHFGCVGRERPRNLYTINEEREREVWRWVCPNEAKSPSIYMQRWGWIHVTVGFLSLHKFVGRPWQFVHNQNKFITSFVHVRIRWSLDQYYTSPREESNKNISCLICVVQGEVWL